jgi:hypothetical protein
LEDFALQAEETKAGRPVAPVWTAVVYVAQNEAAAAEETEKAAAQASVSGFVHAKATMGSKVPRKRDESIMKILGLAVLNCWHEKW